MNAIPEGIIAAASGGSPQGQASTSGAPGAPQNGGGNLPDSGTGTDTAAGGSVDDNWDNYGEPMSSWSFGSIGENHTELRGVCDVSCWGSARALARSAAIMMGWSPQQAHLALEIADYATMFIPSRVISRGAVKTSVIGPVRIGSGAKGVLRPVGQLLESVDDVFANPLLLKGITPSQLMSRINKSDKWVVGTMNKTRSENKGFTLRELNSRGTDYTDRYIQYHPGTPRHFNGQPYWKVHSGSVKDKFPVYGE